MNTLCKFWTNKITYISLDYIYTKMDCVTQEYGVIEKTIKILIQDGESFKKVLTKHFRIKSILSWVGLGILWNRKVFLGRKFWNIFCLAWDDESLVFLRNTQINDKTVWNGQIICFGSSEDKNHKFFGLRKYKQPIIEIV